jgi:general secretion pathway protein F
MRTSDAQTVADRMLEETLSHHAAVLPPSSKISAGETRARLTTYALSRLVRQLAGLLRAGMPLVHALSVLSEQWQDAVRKTTRPAERGDDAVAKMVRRIRDDVNEGASLTESLARHPNVFSPLIVSMVAGGEKSGSLEDVLSRLADMLEKRARLLGKIKAALAYPTMMALVAVAVVTFLLSFVVPSITQLFVQMNQALPWPTRLLISVSTVAREYLILVVAAPCLLVAAVYMLGRTTEGRARLDRLILRLPLFGPLAFRLEAARFTRTFGTLMKSGIPVTGAIEISRDVAQNRVMSDAIDTVRDLVHKGHTIAEAVGATGEFPPVVFHLIATGQMTGKVEDGLIDIADMYDSEVEASVQRLTSLLEPSILLVMGAVVSFIVLAILLPIFEINQAL